MIRRWGVFITIVLLFSFPVLSLQAESKSVPKKKTGITKKKKNASGASANSVKKARKSAKKRQNKSKNIARERNAPQNPGTPMFKVTPLDDGKFLIEPIDSTTHHEPELDSLSLIKKPVFEAGLDLEAFSMPEEEPEPSFPHLLVQFSKQLLGKAYRLGGYGQGNDGIDCSGFMKKIYQAVTLNLPHSSREQAKLGALVTTDWDLSRLRIGDLLFFKRSRGSQIGHTGMYIGEGKMIHSSSRKGVIITNLRDSQYYNRNFVMARRLFIVDDHPLDEFKKDSN